jgi:CubicO group peptidase (beta-lactamase class C family)
VGRRRRWAAGLAALALAGLAVAVVVLITSADRGRRFRTPTGVADVSARIVRATPAAMRAAHVPGAAVAVARDGRLVWMHGFGAAAAGVTVTPATRFQVGSLSKPVTAWGVAAQGVVPLDAPLVDRVRPWPLPPSRYARAVTARRLLSHMAGMSVEGYAGVDPSAPLPSTTASLQGRGPAGAATAVAIVDRPGGRLHYSGGGYTLLQDAIERITGRPFAGWARDAVLRPLAMSESDFAWPPRGTDPIATGHDADGRPLPGYRYGELAAAGLASTARDMGRFTAALLRDDRIAAAFATPQPGTDGHWGLGIETKRLSDGTRFLVHEGINRGWHARLGVYPARGWGFVVLTNGDGGDAVADAVEREFER